MPERAEAEEEFKVTRPWWRFSPSFNVAPRRGVPIVRKHEGEIEGVMLHWGLIPDWAEADASKACVAHIPGDEVEHSAAMRSSWSGARRCILPMFGFYSWQLTRHRYRQPYFVRLVNRAVFGVAALWDRTLAEQDDDVIESCALLTVQPNPLMAELQGSMSQMPAVLERKDYGVWLTAPPAQAKAVLQTCPQDVMVAHPISPRINSLKHDDAHLIQSVEQAPLGSLLRTG